MAKKKSIAVKREEAFEELDDALTSAMDALEQTNSRVSDVLEPAPSEGGADVDAEPSSEPAPNGD